jgi:hypothetical protein
LKAFHSFTARLSGSRLTEGFFVKVMHAGQLVQESDCLSQAGVLDLPTLTFIRLLLTVGPEGTV